MSKVIKSPKLSGRECFIAVNCDPAFGNGLAKIQEKDNQSLPQLENRMAVQARTQQEAETQAFTKGKQAGQLAAQQQHEKNNQVMQSLLQGIDDEVESFFRRMEIRVNEVVMAMVKKIVGTLSKIEPELIQQSVRKVLSQHTELGDILTLHLHPEDYQRMAPDESVAPKNLKMVRDSTVQRGGCMLETKYGLIDARLETQLEELEQTLTAQVAMQSPPSQIIDRVTQTADVRTEGWVINIVGTVIESKGPNVTVGEQCEISDTKRRKTIRAEVIGFKDNRVLLMPLEDAQGIGPGNRVIGKGRRFAVHAGEGLLGRVLNGLGEPIDGLGAIVGGDPVEIHARPSNPMQRQTIDSPLYTGVRAIDGILTCAKGGRMGIFAGSGVGKSVLLGMMARNTEADINVIALIGERGREVREFVERDLGEEGLKRSVVIAVTSDESPVLRIHGAQLAASIAEHFARQGKHVMFMMDSVTRFAMAHREIGLAIGEPPTTKGYTPSTFAALPKLLERSGIFNEQGSITGFYTVLVEGNDMDEPVADHVRSILDGHMVLSRSLFSQNHFPAIDILPSISRLSKQVCIPENTRKAGVLRDNLATYQEAQDLVNIGAYVKGSNKKIDTALRVIDDIKVFLKQGMDEKTEHDAMWKQMAMIADKVGKE
ncbi:FliI/YscN family ATPase [bacterium]|nr:FliI/YscN family ATPase [bacterium]